MMVWSKPAWLMADELKMLSGDLHVNSELYGICAVSHYYYWNTLSASEWEGSLTEKNMSNVREGN